MGRPWFSSLNGLPTFSQETLRVNPIIPQFRFSVVTRRDPRRLCYLSLSELAFPRPAVRP